jgi:hypothetical protein
VNGQPLGTSGPPLWVALVHYPVLNRERNVVTTAITNLDVHDIARAARTYRVRGYVIVTPIERQRDLAQAIVGHWCGGPGASRVPERGEALKLVSTSPSLDDAIATVTESAGAKPTIVATCARPGKATIGFEGVAEMLRQGRPTLILLGTGWGLADEVFALADHVLEPISVPDGDYNHLSVRCAAAVTLDRLLGRHS